MESRKACWYSIIRYSPNNLSGEIINMGLVLHSLDDNQQLNYLILDENTHKVRSIINNRVEANIYKSYKDVLEYYLSKCNDNLSGNVGSIAVSSCYEQNFLDKLYKTYINGKLTLTKPKFAFTEDLKLLFNSLVKTYIGSHYLLVEPKSITTKKHIKEIFEEKKLIGRKVETDLEFNPIMNLDSLRVKIDFGFKNGVWNYIEAIPPLKTPSEISEWFAKTKFAIETLRQRDENSKIHLMYKSSDFKNNITSMFNHLTKEGQAVSGLNIEDKKKFLELCDYIEKEAEDIDGYRAS